MRDFYFEATVKKTRKHHLCSGCARAIEIGSAALRYSGVFSGDFCSHIHHPECRAAEIDLNSLHDVRNGDDWLALTDMEPDDWTWLLEAHPQVAERMAITAEKIAAHEAEQERMRAWWADRGRK